MDPETRTYDKHWIPWTAKQLTESGIDVATPLMPDPWNPVYEKFKEAFEKCEINENTVLIGHSCGCAFLVRWLGDSKRKVARLILVAPWKVTDKDDGYRKEFYEYPIDETIKNRVGRVVMFTSNTEEEDGKKSLKLFNDVLGGKIVGLDNHGHYTMNDIGTDEFPELVKEVLEADSKNN
jgi:predicted alpha/beta hydrolase family esterase